MKKRIVIGILSAQGYHERRERCRKTWLSIARDYEDIEYVFLIGCAVLAPVRLDDLLLLPCPDDYDHLPQKTALFANWALSTFEFDYLFKCDDDTYVCIPRLLEYRLQDHAYVGAFNSVPNVIFASGGAGYFLNRRATDFVARNLPRYPTGLEDVLVATLLKEEGIELSADVRFQIWDIGNNMPAPGNDVITVHGIRSDRMFDIHRIAMSSKFSQAISPLISLRSTSKGYRSHIRPGDSSQSWALRDGQHYPSPRHFESIICDPTSHTVVEINTPAFGYASSSAWLSADTSAVEASGSVNVSLNEQELGTLAPGERTREFRLDSGIQHLFSTAASDELRSPATIWRMRSKESGELRILMPTSNYHSEVAARSLILLDKYWPGHPGVDIVHHERKVATDCEVRQFYAGTQSAVTWCEAVLHYLETSMHGELVLLLLDDYAICQPVCTDLIATAEQIMTNDPSIACFYLTWVMLPSRTKRSFRGLDCIVSPAWSYTAHLQAGIWRKHTLMRILRTLGKASCDTFETEGTAYVNQYELKFQDFVYFNLPDPPDPSMIVDQTDKAHWPVAYHNLMHRGDAVPKYAPFLQIEGLEPLQRDVQSRENNESRVSRSPNNGSRFKSGVRIPRG